jgi:hypothetical protein
MRAAAVRVCNRLLLASDRRPGSGTSVRAEAVVVVVPLVVVPGVEAEPVETFTRTFEPRGTVLFGSGFWAVTIPFG